MKLSLVLRTLWSLLNFQFAAVAVVVIPVHDLLHVEPVQHPPDDDPEGGQGFETSQRLIPCLLGDAIELVRELLVVVPNWVVPVTGKMNESQNG